MYAHEVIESLARLKVGGFQQGAITENYLDWMIKCIAVAQKFHMEPDEEGKFIIPGANSFIGKMGGVELPYESTWLDYKYSESMADEHSRDGMSLKTRKRGILAVKILPRQLFSLNIFNYFETNRGNGWGFSPVEHIIAIDSTIYDHRDFFDKKLPGTLDGPQSKSPLLVGTQNKKTVMDPAASNSVSCFLYGPDDEDATEQFEKTQLQIDSVDVTQFNVFLLLLSCKNICTEEIVPPEKLNKSRLKKGKLPHMTYKVLRISPQENVKAKDGGGGGLWENRIHLCRGHFKEFTEEKPLLGKHVGRYWWQPSVRGRNKDGVVLKDYEINAK